jgi:RHS repeat-associated protein
VTVSYTYDAAGNVTNDGAHTYTYDSENRLVSVDSGATASYSFDNYNRRYKKTVGINVTHYLWEGNQVLAEHNGSTGAVIVDYIYGGSRMIAKVASSTTSYFLSDRLSVRMVLNSSGSVVGQQAHLPFGEDFASSGTQQKQHFTSYERDSETGTDYAVNRQDSTDVGRFTAVDPQANSATLGLPQSWNRYTYALNDPINRKDPLGLFACLVCEAEEDQDPCGISGTTWMLDGIALERPYFCFLRPERDQGPRRRGPEASCYINAKVKEGEQLPANIPLRFLDGSKSVGITDRSDDKGEEQRGFYFKIIIEASVSDNVGLWDKAQYARASITNWYAIVGGELLHLKNVEIPITPESPPSKYFYSNPSKDKWMFWLDTPGVISPQKIAGLGIAVTVSADYFVEVTDVVDNGRGKRCEITWSVKLTIREGRIIQVVTSKH